MLTLSTLVHVTSDKLASFQAAGYRLLRHVLSAIYGL